MLRNALAAALVAFLLPLSALADPVTDPLIRAEISDILARMSYHLDAEDYDAYMAFWAEDATFESGFGPPLQGAEAVRGYLLAGQESGAITGKRHVVSNVMLDRVGDNVRATYYLSVMERQTRPGMIATALLVDEFARIDGAWRIVNHVTAVDPALLNAMRDAAE